VEKAVDLLGGIGEITKGIERIMLKPNLVSSCPHNTTKPEVVKALAQLMLRAGKEISIGEGSAEVKGYNYIYGVFYRTKERRILDPMQQFVFDSLGYTELSRSLKIPLINLHSGEMTEVSVPDGFIFKKITLHKSLADIDMLCSVPMMKTSCLARVTLGMKNLMGVYPGTVYYAPRAWVHDLAEDAGSVGAAGETIDIVRANKLGLVVVDGTMAMEGQGAGTESLVNMDVIIAGMNPLATDMVTANIMGYDISEVPIFLWAQKAGMQPVTLEEIETRGENPCAVRRKLIRPKVSEWKDFRKWYAAKENTFFNRMYGRGSAVKQRIMS
jgi:uncharacterized protein (DUF362 family)